MIMFGSSVIRLATFSRPPKYSNIPGFNQVHCADSDVTVQQDIGTGFWTDRTSMLCINVIHVLQNTYKLSANSTFDYFQQSQFITLT